MPAHEVYIEAFAGSAAVGRLKRPSPVELYVERDAHAAASLRTAMPPAAMVVCGDAMRVLDPRRVPRDAVLYADPPYLASVRADPTRRYYRHELRTDAEHERFLTWVTRLSCRVLLSGYWSQLYHDRLTSWRRLDFGVSTRGGRAIESLWMNYPIPTQFHDARFVGGGFRERERIKRKGRRWQTRLAAMPPAERAAIRAALDFLESSSDTSPRPPSLLAREDCEQKGLFDD